MKASSRHDTGANEELNTVAPTTPPDWADQGAHAEHREFY
jgi:hypothetical protein